MINRFIEQNILKDIKVHQHNVVLYGARQVGKTTLVKRILEQLPGNSLIISADEKKYVSILSSRDSGKMRELLDSYDIVVIDEAQKIQDVSINLKILIDAFPNKRFIFTGSSSFELRSSVKESLPGRVVTHTLHPLWTKEIQEHTAMSAFQLGENISSRLLFGDYPKVHKAVEFEEKKRQLKQLMETSLLKDMTLFMKLDQEATIQKLLQLLSYQIGNEVSVRELSKILGVSTSTVNVYLSILEKSQIIFMLPGYSNNMRNEVTRNPKVYFWDVGIRNVLIEKFDDLDIRDDIGALWENFIISERMKKMSYTQIFPPKSYFWRLYSGSEIDYVERSAKELDGFEIKWVKKANKPATWSKYYPDAHFTGINRDNWIRFVT